MRPASVLVLDGGNGLGGDLVLGPIDEADGLQHLGLELHRDLGVLPQEPLGVLPSLAELVAVATTRGFHAMFARIVGPQEASVRLHERHGFTMVGIEREVGRKFNRWHDVGLMQRLL